VTSMYPDKLCTSGNANNTTLQLVAEHKPKIYAEFGCYRCDTAAEVAKLIPSEGTIHLFDFQDTLDEYSHRVMHPNVIRHGNSQKLRDSYNWSLMRFLLRNDGPVFDYAYIDGAHTWDVDGFTFFLVDRLLKPGGVVEFDDYDWKLGQSGSLKPSKFPNTANFYTREQIYTPQVKLVVDLLVKRDPRYKELVTNRAYQKVSA
jgi:hypothetical protein